MAAARLQPATRADVQRLSSMDGATILSIYHPTEQAIVQPEENSLHLKSLIGRSAELLEAKDVRGKELDTFLGPLEELLDDRDLWMHQKSGLAIFRSADSFDLFGLPHQPPELAHLGSTPRITPLLPSIWPEQSFYVLALAQQSIRLVRCTRHHAEEVDLSELDMPATIGEELRYDDLQRPDLLHHPTTGPGRSSEGQGGQTGRQQKGRRHDFHGHGQGADDHKVQIARFFQALDRGLHTIFRSEHRPVILAGVDYLHPIFRSASRYPNILDDHINGSVEHLRIEELHDRARPIVEKAQRAELDELRELYGNAGSQGLGETDLGRILQAAERGQIDTLFLTGMEPRSGHHDPATDKVTLDDRLEGSGGSEDLHDLAARKTISASGRVLVLEPEEMPVSTPAAALLRYSD